MADQLDMFGAPKPAGPPPVTAAASDEGLRALGAGLPPSMRFGTSSWSFTGWKDIVYADAFTNQRLSREGLPAYAAHPLLRSVGVDRTFYGPASAAELEHYAKQVPEDFRFLVKAHAECTLTRFGPDRRWGARAGQANERFLNVDYACEAVVEPFVEGLGRKGGVLLFQFTPQALATLGGVDGFPNRLHDFFSALPALPHEAVYAVEVRNAPLLTPRYFEALGDVDVEHCLNALPGMPTIAQQFSMRLRHKRAAGNEGRGALVIRWMLNRRHDYQGAKARYAPFDALVDEDPETREDIARALVESRVPSYTIVNNKAEGSSPLSIRRLVESILGRRG